MKILYLLDSLTPGGTETSTVALASELVGLGHDVRLLVLRHESDGLEDEAAAAGVQVRVVEPGSAIRQVLAVRRMIRRFDPDVVHTALYRADQIGRLASIGLHPPVVSSFVSTPYDAARFSNPDLRRWKLRSAQVVDAVTARVVRRFHAVSEGAATENARALRLPPSRITIVHRGRRAEDFAAPTPARLEELRGELGVAEGVPVVLNIGRLDPLKAQHTLIEAVEELLPRVPHLQLLIAGKPGASSGEIERCLECRPDLARHVHLLGHRSDVGDLLHLADVLVISSIVEGTAGAAIEAMAAGTPVVSTRVRGAVGILEHEHNAVLVDQSAAAIADGLRRVLAEPALARQLAKRGREDFEEQFTLQKAAQAYLALYADVAGRQTRGPRPRSR